MVVLFLHFQLHLFVDIFKKTVSNKNSKNTFFNFDRSGVVTPQKDVGSNLTNSTGKSFLLFFSMCISFLFVFFFFSKKKFSNLMTKRKYDFQFWLFLSTFYRFKIAEFFFSIHYFFDIFLFYFFLVNDVYFFPPSF